MTEKLEAVYVLFHVLPLPEGEEEDRLIGVYSSRERAKLAQMKLQDQPVFRDAPDGFITDRYIIGEDCWTNGYVTIS